MSGSQPRVSVVTPTFNSARTVRDTIESVRRQDYGDVEHIIMDGGSTDGTLDILREYPGIIWESEPDEGHYHAMNKGMERASGDIVAVLNSDDCYCEGVVSSVVEAFESHGEWDVLFGDVRFVDDAMNEIYRREEGCFDYDVLRFGCVMPIIDQTIFYRRRVFSELGGLDYKRFKNCCDFDLVCRMGRAGYRVGHVNKIFVNYRYHDFGQSADKRVRRNMMREGRQICVEHGASENEFVFQVMRLYARLRRQWFKLRYRGKVDLVTGNWKLRKHLREATTFSSNIGVDKLESE